MRVAMSVMVLMSLFLLPASASAEWKGQVVEEDGQKIIRNPEIAPETITVTPEERWSRGDEEDEVFFGMPSQILGDDEGIVYVLDGQVSEIVVFSRDGEYLRTIGREGEGPGEFRGAADMFMRSGGLIGVVVVFPGKIVQLALDGSPAGVFPYPPDKHEGFQLLFRGQAAAGRIVLSGSKQRQTDGAQNEQENYLKSVDMDGNETAHFHSTKEMTQYGGMEFDEKTFNNFTQYWSAAPDGRVASALTFDDYRIHVWKADGSLDYVIERPGYEALERSAEDKERMHRFFEGITSWNPGSTFKTSDTHRAVSQLWFRPDGSLWVLSGRGSYERDEGVFASLDVYDAEGKFIRKMIIKGPGDPTEDGIFFAGGRLYRVTDLFSAFISNFGGGGSAGAVDEAAEPLQIIAYDFELPELGAAR